MSATMTETSKFSRILWFLQFNVIPLVVMVPIIYLCHRYLSRKERDNIYINGYVDNMVDNYFYGYLSKVIPSHGKNEGLQDKLKLYKEEQDLSDEEFPFHKMFVLITSSGYIRDDLYYYDKDRISRRRSVEPTKLSRAGVIDRLYQTSIYKIKFKGDPTKHISLVIEGAPPVLTLHDSSKENPELKKYKKEIIHLFYTKLTEKIKNSKELEDSVQPIFFDDEGYAGSLADFLIYLYLDNGQPLKWSSVY